LWVWVLGYLGMGPGAKGKGFGLYALPCILISQTHVIRRQNSREHAACGGERLPIWLIE
jgi:hypothetical protein